MLVLIKFFASSPDYPLSSSWSLSRSFWSRQDSWLVLGLTAVYWQPLGLNSWSPLAAVYSTLPRSKGYNGPTVLTIMQWSLHLKFSRNCLIGGSYQVKISDSAICRPVYSSDYFHVPESTTEDLLPLRWVPWEVYVMVSWNTKPVSSREKSGYHLLLSFAGTRVCSNWNVMPRALGFSTKSYGEI